MEIESRAENVARPFATTHLQMHTERKANGTQPSTIQNNCQIMKAELVLKAGLIRTWDGRATDDFTRSVHQQGLQRA